MQNLQEKPTISEKSRTIAMNSVRYSKPLYSPERYGQEIENIRMKKEMAEQ